MDSIFLTVQLLRPHRTGKGSTAKQHMPPALCGAFLTTRATIRELKQKPKVGQAITLA